MLQLLTLVLNVASPTGRFWNGVEKAGEYYEVIGGSICGSFVIVGGISVLCYKPWRRWVERERMRMRAKRDGQTGVAEEVWNREGTDGGDDGAVCADQTDVEELVEVGGMVSVQRVGVKAYDIEAGKVASGSGSKSRS